MIMMADMDEDQNYAATPEDEEFFRTLFWLLDFAMGWSVIRVPNGKRAEIVGLRMLGNTVLSEGIARLSDRPEDDGTARIALFDCTFEECTSPSLVAGEVVRLVNAATTN